MKFYQKRGFALIVLILAIIGAGVWGLHKKPISLPNVKHYNWIADEENLLSANTEKVIQNYNSSWDSNYRAVIAVATVDSVRGWKLDDFADTLGNKWGLGPNDMLLLLVEDDNYYVACGDNVLDAMTDTQQAKLQSAIEPGFYSGRYDDAVVAFFRQADVYYAQAMSNASYNSTDNAGGWKDHQGINISGVILLLIAFFVVWVILDRMRYNRYRRRYMGPTVVTPVVTYYPIFWGRTPRPVPPAAPRPPHSPSGGYAAPRPARPAQTRPSGTPQRPVTTNRPRGFGGNSRGGSSMSRSGGMSSGGGMSRGGGNSRGGFGGGGFGGKHR